MGKKFKKSTIIIIACILCTIIGLGVFTIYNSSKQELNTFDIVIDSWVDYMPTINVGETSNKKEANFYIKLKGINQADFTANYEIESIELNGEKIDVDKIRYNSDNLKFSSSNFKINNVNNYVKITIKEKSTNKLFVKELEFPTKIAQ